jgi:vacuolar protein sorting-associated protein 54
LVAEVKQTQPMIQVLLNEGDYVGALDLIEHAGKYLKGMSSHDSREEKKELGPGVSLQHISLFISKNIDLKGVKCLGTLSQQLYEVSRTIFSVMEADLIHILLKDLLDIVKTPVSISSIKDKQNKFVSAKLTNSPAALWIQKIIENQFNTTLNNNPMLELPSETLLSQEEELKAKLVPTVLGLLRINRLDEALRSFKERLLIEIKELSKKARHFFCKKNE